MPLYDDLETRPIRLEPSYQEVDMPTLLREAALSGGLGAGVSSAAGRAMVPYVSPPPGLPPRSTFGPGLDVPDISIEDRIAATRRARAQFNAALGARNNMASAPGRSGQVYIDLITGMERPSMKRVPQTPNPRHIDLTEQRITSIERDDPKVWKALRESADKDLLAKYEDDIHRAARARLFPPPDAPGLLITNDPEVLGKRFTNEAFQSGANRAPQPGRLARMGAGAKRFAGAALGPAGIAKDLLLGSAVGAGSAGLGYASAAPESAGLFTPPGEGYEGLVRTEDIERVIAQKELEKEAERQRLLEQYRASGYDLGPNTRLRDLR